MTRLKPSHATEWMESESSRNIGNALHAYAAQIIYDYIKEHPDRRPPVQFHDSGLTDMSNQILQTYLNEVTHVFYTEREAGNHPLLFLEYPLRTNRYGPEIGTGVADAFIIAGNRVTVFDLKTGIEPTKNHNQLILYALAILHDFRLEEGTVFELTLIQPRCAYAKRSSVYFTGSELKEEYWKLADFPVLKERLGGKLKSHLYLIGDRKDENLDD